MSNTYRFPLFATTRNDERTLVSQTTDVLRQAILTGFYRSGEKLPPMRELCKAAGVSMIVMNDVVAKLAEEGLVNPRRGVGCEVLGKGEFIWKGRVLFVVPESDGTYFVNVMLGTIREALMKEGWLFQQVTLGSDDNSNHDFSRLNIALRVSTNLVLTIWERSDILNALAASKIPYVTIAERHSNAPGSVGNIKYSHRAFASAFVDDCLAAGIKKVEQVGFMRSTFTAVPNLRCVGIEVKETVISPINGMASTIMDVKQPVMDFFIRRLANGKSKADLPDLFYFDDDNVAEAALSALAYNGVKVPDDVRVVAFSNAGLGPCFPGPLARVEMNPVVSGKIVARAVHSYLSGNGLPEDAIIKPEYLRGPSFPVENLTKKGSKR